MIHPPLTARDRIAYEIPKKGAGNMDMSDNIRSRAIGLLSSFRLDLLSAESLRNGEANNTRGTVNSCPDKHLGSPNELSGGLKRTGEIVESDSGSGCLSDEHVRALIAWLNMKVTRDRLGGVTAKCYRRWLASYFESVNDPCANVIRNWIPPGSHEETLIKDEADARLLQGPQLNMHPAPAVADSNSNTRYLSYLSRDSMKALLDVLVSERNGQPRYTLGPAVALFFTSTMMTGLRPMEWPTARFRETFYDPEQNLTLGPVLDVLTLKQQSRRDDNPLRDRRYMVLDSWPPEQIASLKSFLSMVEEHESDFKSFYNSIRMTINRAWQQVQKAPQDLDGPPVSHQSYGHASKADGATSAKTPLTVSLYTARHIFAEECRRSRELTRFELAALLGHSMLTNQVYYGPRQDHADRGYSFIIPRPWPGDADDIMKWDETVNPRRNQFRQGDLFAGPQAALNPDVSETLWNTAELSSLFPR